VANESTAHSCCAFWELLLEEERSARAKFSRLPLVLEQLNTARGGLSAVTMQVQLCEYRQFRNSVARLSYGLAFDEAMKVPEKAKRVSCSDHMEYDAEGQRVWFEVPVAGHNHRFHVPVSCAGGSVRLAERVALHCFQKFRGGGSLADIDAYREELCAECQGQEDVHEDSDAWSRCRVSGRPGSLLVSFHYLVGAIKVAFQTTVNAVGGNIMEADRIARLCFARFERGDPKEKVLQYRQQLYKQYVTSRAKGEGLASAFKAGGVKVEVKADERSTTLAADWQSLSRRGEGEFVASVEGTQSSELPSVQTGESRVDTERKRLRAKVKLE